MNIKEIAKHMLTFGAFVGGMGGVTYFSQKYIKKKDELYRRYRSYYEVTNQWLVNKNEGKNILDYFERNHYQRIAIYGMGTLSELLCQDLKNTNVEIAYFIDKNAEQLYGLDDKPVIRLDEINKQENVDVIIVTPIFLYADILNTLKKQEIDTEIVSLEDVIFD